MPKITLEDLVKKEPQEITQQIQQNAVKAPVVEEAAPVDAKTSVQESSNGAAVTEEKGPRKKLTFDKSLLKGKFAVGTEFKKGEKHSVVTDEATSRTSILEVLGVEKSAGRVKFKDETTGEVFSVAFTHLFGQEKFMPFKKGDVVKFEDKDYEVKGLNPASQNVVLFIDGKTRYVKVSRVTLVLSAPVATPELKEALTPTVDAQPSA